MCDVRLYGGVQAVSGVFVQALEKVPVRVEYTAVRALAGPEAAKELADAVETRYDARQAALKSFQA